MRKTTPLPTSSSSAVVQFSEMDAPFGYVYAIGQLHAHFPSLDVEKEFLQLQTPADLLVTSEAQRLYNVLIREENLFLAREMAWLLHVENVPTHQLRPRSQVELRQMIEAIKPDAPPPPKQEESPPQQYDVVIGVQEPSYAAEDGGLPGAVVNRLFHFTDKSVFDGVQIPPSISQMPAGVAKDQAMLSFRTLMNNIFTDMLQLSNNTGDTDEHRALNYVSLNYPDIYLFRWNPTGTGDLLSFRGVSVRHSILSRGVRRIVDIIFNYVNASNVESRFYTSVDVTGQFPFLVTKLQPYFER